MKRLLLISYYFPPSGGPGVQRTLKFVKYLPDNGWLPTVLTVDPKRAAYPDLDASLMADVPENADVVRTRSWDPYGSYARLQGRSKDDAVGVSFVQEESGGLVQRIALWTRANLFVPDARIGWLPFAKKAAAALHDHEPFDAVLTTGPPHSSHLVGRWLARHRKLPWVVDLRDPWTGIHYYSRLPVTRIAATRDRRYERSVIEEADAVVVVSPGMIENLSRRVVRNYNLIPNGFDPADFPDASVARSSSFSIRHLGTLSASQNPVAVWEGLRRLRSSEGTQAEIELIGNVDPEIVAEIRNRGLDRYVHLRPYVEHDRAIRLMQEASLLLLVIPDVTKSGEIVTGKIFEYLASGRPIMGIGPPDGDAANILRESGGGLMFGHRDVDGVSQH
ncbi:MAG: glycosyltransferase, partial [Rhodothermales bacterium]|nr:glycosyltransferase [Rhodothermales bacterium]